LKINTPAKKINKGKAGRYDRESRDAEGRNWGEKLRRDDSTREDAETIYIAHTGDSLLGSHAVRQDRGGDPEEV